MPGFSYKPESETRYSLLQCNIFMLPAGARRHTCLQKDNHHVYLAIANFQG